MKTSIKIFLGSMILLGAGLVIYDFQLDAVFRQKEYTKPFYDYDTLTYTGFDRIELNSSTAVTIMLVRGDFKVLANPGTRDFLQIRQEGTSLIIDARFRYHYRNVFGDNLLYISCPNLKSFKTDARYTAGDVDITDSINRELWFKQSTIAGFRLDSLSITAINAGNLQLENDTVRALRAVVGRGAALTIDRGNRFDTGDLEVMNRAKLRVNASDIRNLNFHLADSAGLILNGAAAKTILKLSRQ